MSAFPPTLPTSLDDAAIVAAHDWAAFQALGHMDTHWRRPGWIPGRRSYHWMVTFDEEDVHEALGRHVARVREAVPSQGFDLVPVESVHLTLGRVGFTDELAHSVAMSVGEHARRAADRPAAFELAVGPLTGSRGAIRFSVSPWTPLIELHVFLAAVTRSQLGARCVMDTASFRPHIGIAYAHTRMPVPAVVAALDLVRGVPGPHLLIHRASLVELERVDRSYRYRTLVHVELSPRKGAAADTSSGIRRAES